MEDERENQEIQKAVKDLYDLQADYYIQRDKCDKYIDAIDKILGIEHTPANNFIKNRNNDIYKQLSCNEMRVINHARKILDLNIEDDITVVFGRKEQYTVRVLLEIIDQLLEQSLTKNELVKRVDLLQKLLNSENNRCAKLAMLNTELRESINNYLDSLPHDVTMTYRLPEILIQLLKKGDCDEKQWNSCRVEKMGCEGCTYDDYSGKNEGPKMRPINYSKNSEEG